LAQVGAGGQRRAIAGECAVPNERSQSRTFYCQDIMVEFYHKEWKWLLPFLVALCGVMVAIAKLK
jgi:hypothetical protein